jgi:hypothetical protein
MDTDIEALIMNGGAVLFRRNAAGNVECVASTASGSELQAEGRTVHDALVTVMNKARQATNQKANPHLDQRAV